VLHGGGGGRSQDEASRIPREAGAESVAPVITPWPLASDEEWPNEQTGCSEEGGSEYDETNAPSISSPRRSTQGPSGSWRCSSCRRPSDFPDVLAHPRVA
jgi:hypothetical protein